MFFSFQGVQPLQSSLPLLPMPIYCLYFSSNSTIPEVNFSDVNLSEEKQQSHSTLMLKQTNDSNSVRNVPKKLKICLNDKRQKISEKVYQHIQPQYKPRNRSSKKNVKAPSQNAYRNILPNIIHQIFCFIQKQKRSGQIVRHFLASPSICQERKFEIDRYYRYQRLLKDKTNHYINMKGLKQLNKFQEPSFEIYSQAQQLKFIHMNRILLKYFLQHQFENIILTSSRMKSQTRLWNFQLKRKILTQLHQIFEGF